MLTIKCGAHSCSPLIIFSIRYWFMRAQNHIFYLHNSTITHDTNCLARACYLLSIHISVEHSPSKGSVIIVFLFLAGFHIHTMANQVYLYVNSMHITTTTEHCNCTLCIPPALLAVMRHSSVGSGRHMLIALSCK